MKKYNWLLKILGCATLLVFAALVYFVFEEKIVYLLTGIAVIIFALIRLVPLIKSLKTDNAKILNSVEIVGNIVIGALLLIFTFTESTAMKSIYKYLLASVLYFRGLVYFITTSVFKEETDTSQFWFHIIFLTLGAVIAVIPQITAELLSVLLVVLSLLVALYLGISGGMGYANYRKNFNNNSSNQRDLENKRPEQEKRSDVNNFPEDEKRDRPYVN